MKDLISVIVPVYMVEHYIDRCIQSIVNQTYTNLEIILVDDGSPDNCPEKCDDWAKKDARIKVIHKVNAGISMARNSGLEIAKGSFLMFVDSDDYLSHGAVKTLYQKIIQDESDMAVGGFVYVNSFGDLLSNNGNEFPNGVFSAKEVFQQLGTGTKNEIPCVVWGKLYRRKVMENIQYPELSCSEDLMVFPSVISNCNKVSTVATIVYYYVQHSKSITHMLTDRRRTDWILASLYVTRFLLNMNLLNNAKCYYTGAIFQAANMKDVSGVRKLLKRSFSVNERLVLLKKNPHAILRWVSLYIPAIRWVLRLRHKNKEKQNE